MKKIIIIFLLIFYSSIAYPSVKSEYVEYVRLPLISGESFGMRMDYTTGKGKNKKAIDITGYIARGSIKTNLDGTLLLDLTTENGRILFLNPKKGQIKMFLSAEDTSALPKGKLYIELKLIKGTKEIKLLQGKLRVTN